MSLIKKHFLDLILKTVLPSTHPVEKSGKYSIWEVQQGFWSAVLHNSFLHIVHIILVCWRKFFILLSKRARESIQRRKTAVRCTIICLKGDVCSSFLLLLCLNMFKQIIYTTFSSIVIQNISRSVSGRTEPQ